MGVSDVIDLAHRRVALEKATEALDTIKNCALGRDEARAYLAELLEELIAGACRPLELEVQALRARPTSPTSPSPSPAPTPSMGTWCPVCMTVHADRAHTRPQPIR